MAANALGDGVEIGEFAIFGRRGPFDVMDGDVGAEFGEPLGHEVVRHAPYQRFNDDAVAADIPARLEADLGVPETHPLGGFHIVLVELAGGDLLPMPDLARLGPADLRLVGKETGDLGHAHQLLVEQVHGSRQVSVEVALQLAEALQRRLVEADERQAFGKFGSLLLR